MFNLYDIATFCGYCATIISIFCYSTGPAPPYLNLIKGKVGVNDVPCLLLVFTFLNCHVWTCYALRDGQFLVWFPCLIGGICTLIYIFIFVVFYVKKKIIYSICVITLILNVILQLTWIFYVIIKNNEAVGLFCMIFNILMCAGTLEKFVRVIKTHNYNLIPIFSSIIMFFNNVCWVIYGFGYEDINIIIPCALGVFFQIIAIGLFLYYKIRFPEAGLIKENNNNVPKDNEKEPQNDIEKKAVIIQPHTKIIKF
jgi:uncharacterized protein with PQ loop repeat